MNNILIMKRVTNNFYKELDSIYLRSKTRKSSSPMPPEDLNSKIKGNSKRDDFD